MKKFTALFLCLISCSVLFSGCASKLEKEIKKVSKNLTNYTIDINYSDYSLTATQYIDYINSSDVCFDKLYMHLYPNNFSKGATNTPVSALNMKKAYPNGFSEGHITINKVSVNGQEQETILSGVDYDILEVVVNSLAPGDRVGISLEYSVVIPNCLHRFGYGDNTINVANFYPIMAVYDGEWNLDPYDSNGDPFYSDVANYDVTISAPSDMVIASTGEVVNTETTEEITTHNVSAKAVRDFAFVMSNKFSVATEKYENVNISYYYYDDENYAQNLKAGVDSIRTFSNLFGAYPYKTYSIVKTNFIHGGMEYPNMVFISDSVTDINDYINVIVHETAHQWWYGLVGNNEYDCGWLDEGLTDYSTALFYKNNPDYGVNFDEIIKNTTNSYVTFVEVYTKVLGTVDTTMTRKLSEYDTEPEYVYMAYVKGVLLFDSLMENVGEDKFINTLQKYFKDNKYKNATPDDLIGAFEKNLCCDMRGFFDSWLNGNVVIQRVA